MSIAACKANLPFFTKIIFSTSCPSWIKIAFFLENNGMKFVNILTIKSEFLHPLNIFKLSIVCLYIVNKTEFFNE